MAVVAADERTPVPGFFDLPVTGGTNTYDMLGLKPEERGIAIALLARSMFNLGSGAAERAASVRKHIAAIAAAVAFGPRQTRVAISTKASGCLSASAR